MLRLAPTSTDLRIRIEASCVLETDNLSGIGRYVEQLLLALESHQSIELDVVCGPFPSRWITANKAFRKLNHYLPDWLQIPFDLLRRRVNVTIFPNFSTLRTVKSTQRAVIIHDLVYKQFPDTVEHKNLSFLTKEVPRSLRTCDTLITTTDTVASQIRGIFNDTNISSNLITPIPPASTYFEPAAISREELAQKYKFADQKYIYFIGNMEPRKNLGSLLTAYSLLPDKVRGNYSLVIGGGEGWKSHQTKARIQQMRQSEESVFAVGYINELDAPSLMHHAAVLCLPSIDEGYGMSPFQAMATRTPVVANDIPIIRELTAPHSILVNSTDPQQLANGLLKATLITPKSHPKLEAAHQYVRDLSWSSNASNIYSHFTHS